MQNWNISQKNKYTYVSVSGLIPGFDMPVIRTKYGIDLYFLAYLVRKFFHTIFIGFKPGRSWLSFFIFASVSVSVSSNLCL